MHYDTALYSLKQKKVYFDYFHQIGVQLITYINCCKRIIEVKIEFI